MEDVVDCNHEFFTAASDEGPLRITKQGSAMIRFKKLGSINTIRLLDVQYNSNLGRNIISFGLLEKKGCVLEYREGRRILVSHPGGSPIMDVDRINDVLIVNVYDDILTDTFHVCGSPLEAVIAILNGDGDGNKTNVRHMSLLQFHRRLGHLCYDTIVKMVRDPASGIKLTDT